ncbi:MAG: phosphoribosylformylglycinamidine synthase subunit PurS [Nitrospirae bacterium]|nr:phosphoribosylformylglycinamidine synthase subunit PurS [Candidatus Manganitrophaceae bacterium]
MKAKVYTTLKSSILDPQGKTVERALSVLGFDEVKSVRVGKYLELDLESGSIEDAEKSLKAMCEKLLANTVMESYRFEIDPEV